MSYVTPVKIDEKIRFRLKAICDTQKRTVSWSIREAITEYVEREEKKEQFKQEALATWRNYQLTGLHVTAEEARAWLLELEAGEDKEPPVCHV